MSSEKILETKLKKQPFVNYKVYENWCKARANNSKAPITATRSSTVIEQFIGYTFRVHNGKTWTQLFIHENMVNSKFGSFVLTKKAGKHAGTGPKKPTPKKTGGKK